MVLLIDFVVGPVGAAVLLMFLFGSGAATTCADAAVNPFDSTDLEILEAMRPVALRAPARAHLHVAYRPAAFAHSVVVGRAVGVKADRPAHVELPKLSDLGQRRERVVAGRPRHRGEGLFQARADLLRRGVGSIAVQAADYRQPLRGELQASVTQRSLKVRPAVIV